MIDELRSFFRRFPFAFSILSKIYQKFVLPIETGHFQYFLRYSIKIKRTEINKLNKHGFQNVVPIICREWRIGREKDHAYRRYYEGTYNQKKCFIKIGTNDATVHNECIFGLNGYQQQFSFSPEFITGDLNFDENTVLLAVEFIDDLQRFKVPQSIDEFDDLCKQFNKILDILNDNGIVHADIHKGNLMTKNKQLILMDYGISMKKEMGNQINYNARPGTFYQNKGKGRVYDDAYSFVEMIHGFSLPVEFLDLDSYKTIQSKVGRNYFYTEL